MTATKVSAALFLIMLLLMLVHELGWGGANKKDGSGPRGR